MKKNKKTSRAEGLAEFIVALALIAALVCIVIFARGCSADHSGSDTPETEADTSENISELEPIASYGIEYPIEIADGITLDWVYTATGYFPEDATDDMVEDVLAAKFTNTTDRSLEYMTLTLTVNGEEYPFSIKTLPAGRSVYVFNSDRLAAPTDVTEVTSEVEYQVFFADEPTLREDVFKYTVTDGMIAVTNVTDEDITADFYVYYKSTAGEDLFGGITYRFKVSGTIKAGESFNGYTPHAYSHMTEVMFTDYES